jgi:hypothetical protein
MPFNGKDAGGLHPAVHGKVNPTVPTHPLILFDKLVKKPRFRRIRKNHEIKACEA